MRLCTLTSKQRVTFKKSLERTVASVLMNGTCVLKRDGEQKHHKCELTSVIRQEDEVLFSLSVGVGYSNVWYTNNQIVYDGENHYAFIAYDEEVRVWYLTSESGNKRLTTADKKFIDGELRTLLMTSQDERSQDSSVNNLKRRER